MARKKKQGFPSLADVKREAGPLGLRNPKLQKTWGKLVSYKQLFGR
jgi:hypothetical protein